MGQNKIMGSNSPKVLGSSTSNRYINISNQGTGTLTGADVDPKLVKADRLIDFAERMTRQINPETVNNLISAGEIDASWVYIEILRTPASIFVENSFMSGNNIGPITIYRADVINGKLTVTDQIEYQNCIITGFESSSVEEKEGNLDTFKAWFHYTQRQRTLLPFDNKGQALGNLPSLINFPEGTLKPAAGGGGGGGEAGGGE